MSAVLEFKSVCGHDTVDSPSRCSECRKAVYRANRNGMMDTRKTVVLTETGRTCLKCGDAKSWGEFAKDIHGYNQKTATCKECRNIKYRQVYKDNPSVRRLGGNKIRQDKLKRVYGITYADAVRTLDNQFNKCANHGCGKEISLDEKANSPNRAVIDHCHTSGKFRGLLCNKCNLDLGMIESNEMRFLGLMDYKIKHNHKLKE